MASASLKSFFSAIRLWAKAFRVHQWVKNTLIFVPFVLAGSISTFAEFKSTMLGLILLCLTASATYIINDISDIENDRQHVAKKFRPFASGSLSVQKGVIAIVVLAFIITYMTLRMPERFAIVLVTYTALTLFYSFFLKSRSIIDVVTIAILFTLRIAAGMTLLSSPISYWLLTFSLFFFLSLALVKRYAELNDLAEQKGHKVSGRVYVVTDRPFIMSAGLASAFAGCLVFVIYIANEHFSPTIYSSPVWLWAICCILIYWLVRTWFLTSRGAMHQDPIIFALTDRASIAMGVLTLLFVALAW